MRHIIRQRARQQRTPGRFRNLSRAAVGALTLSLLLLGAAWMLPSRVAAQPGADDSFVSRYTAILQRQAELYFDDALSALRIESAYMQLWHLYNDPTLNYWQQELTDRLLGLIPELVPMPQRFAQALQIVATYDPIAPPVCESNPGSEECLVAQVLEARSRIQVTCGQGQACEVARVQEAATRVALRTYGILHALGHMDWSVNWSQQWKQAMQNIAQTLEQEIATLRADFPMLERYITLSQVVAKKSEKVLADATVQKQVERQYQAFTKTVQKLAEQMNYTEQVQDFQQRLQALAEANPTYQELKAQGENLVASLNALRQGVHRAITVCAQYGYGNACFDPAFNQHLQGWLPQYNAYYNEAIMAAAEFQELYNYESFIFSQSRAVLGLNREFREEMQEVAPDLRRAQNRLIKGIKAIPQTRQLGQLMNRMVESAQQLERQ